MVLEGLLAGMNISVVVGYWGLLGLVSEEGDENESVLRPHPVLGELLAFPPT